MATHSVSGADPAHPSESTQGAGFHELLSRLLNVVHHIQLVDQRLFDLQGVPEELQPAAVALHDATEALDRLHADFDRWHVAVVGESAPPIAPEALAAQVSGAAAFSATPQGEALTDTEEALYAGIALLSVALGSLENETGERDGVEREVETLRIALERLEAARGSLDIAELKAVAAHRSRSGCR